MHVCFMELLKLSPAARLMCYVAEKLLENVLATWGLFSMISIDQNTHFTGQIL